MRSLYRSLIFSFVVLSGCGVGSVFGGPKADMTALAPVDDSDESSHHPHHSSPMDEGLISSADAANDVNSGERNVSTQPSSGFSYSGGGGEDGNGNTVDVTPHPAIPDTEVSYGKSN